MYKVQEALYRTEEVDYKKAAKEYLTEEMKYEDKSKVEAARILAL